MNCLECQDLLQRRLDGETVPGSAALEQHLAGCQSCRHTHAAGALLLEGLKELPPSPPLPAEFTRHVVGSILRDRQRRRARMRRRVWVTAGLAAAILLMVWAGNIWLPERNNVEAPAPALVDGTKKQDPPSPAPQPPAEEKVTPLAKSVDAARNDVLAMTSRWADQTKDQARLFVSLPEMPDFLGSDTRFPMDEPLDPAAQSLRQAGQGVSDGLHAVSRNARRAVSFFMKELPVPDIAN